MSKHWLWLLAGPVTGPLLALAFRSYRGGNKQAAIAWLVAAGFFNLFLYSGGIVSVTYLIHTLAR